MPKLSSLWLDGIGFTEVPDYIRQLTRLQDLGLSCNSISDFSLSDVCPGVDTSSDIDHNQVTRIRDGALYLPDSFKTCSIYLNNNEVAEIEDEAFGPLQTNGGGYLETVDLRSNQLQSFNETTFRYFLDFNYNKFLTDGVRK